MSTRRFVRVFASAVLSLIVVGRAPASAADSGSAAEGTRTYGTADQTVSTIGAWEFVPVESDVTWSLSAGFDRYLSSAGTLVAAVHLPAGASVSAMEIQGCDFSNVGYLAAILYSNSVSGGLTEPPTPHAGVSSSPQGSPGCDFFFASVPSPVTIDNHRRTYFVWIRTNVATDDVAFSAVRLYYTLQMSPAPLTPTFGDVPKNFLYFRAIEALAASGITGGCGNGNFCPNQNVTRGEMAAFFARALGLHWPY